MPVPIVAAAGAAGKVYGAVKGLFSTGSPRYAGGPLISTVRAGAALIAAGDLATIRKWDTARKTAEDKEAWQQVWENELPSIGLTTAQATLVRQLDPRLGITGVGAGASLPATPSLPSTPDAPGSMSAAGDIFGGGTRTLLIGVVLVAIVLVVLLKGR